MTTALKLLGTPLGRVSYAVTFVHSRCLGPLRRVYFDVYHRARENGRKAHVHAIGPGLGGIVNQGRKVLAGRKPTS